MFKTLAYKAGGNTCPFKESYMYVALLPETQPDHNCLHPRCCIISSTAYTPNAQINHFSSFFIPIGLMMVSMINPLFPPSNRKPPVIRNAAQPLSEWKSKRQDGQLKPSSSTQPSSPLSLSLLYPPCTCVSDDHNSEASRDNSA